MNRPLQVLIATAFALGMFMLPAGGVPELEVGGLFQDPHEQYQQGRYADAREGYAAIIDDPASPPEIRCLAKSYLIDAWLGEGDYAQARAACVALLEWPDLPPHFAVLARQRLDDMDRMEAGRPVWDLERTRIGAPVLPEPEQVFYVAPDGADDNPGTEKAPFATLERVRDAMASFRKDHPDAGPVAALLRGGDYPRRESFVLDAEDSGTAGAPIVYRAYPGETPRLTGGLPVTGFEPVSHPEIRSRLPEASRDQVLQCDLNDLGVTHFPPLMQRGMSIAGKPLMELFFNGKPMQVARWPNEGFVHVGAVHETEGDRHRFEYAHERPARWTGAHDIWLFGYWYHHWADSTLSVAALDPEARRIETAQRSPYDIREGQHYYYFNLLEEIDAPGEWYLDRESGILYFYPPGPVDEATVELSVLQEPFIVLNGVSHVVFEGLTLDIGGDMGVKVAGGGQCMLLGCTLSRLGNDAVHIERGFHHTILGCDMFALARKGIHADCGDRATLTPGGLVIENNHIHDFSRIDRTYTPAVWMDGVGGRVAHNLFHNSPHQAIRLEGNDHLILFNEIHSVVYESDDQSGIDMWLDASYRGNLMHYNFWHHIGSPLERHGQAGIRLDDAICGVSMYGNIFYRSAGGIFGAIQIHGGKENVIDNNLFIQCKSAVSFSAWSPDRWREFLKSDLMQQRIAGRVDISKPPYTERYPELARLGEDPNRNFVWRNLAVNCGALLLRAPEPTVAVDNLEIDVDPGFADPETFDFRLDEDNPVHNAFGFRPIPANLIGLYADKYRASWPIERQIAAGYTEESFATSPGPK